MTLVDFLSGAISMGFLICALFFARFWSRTHDRLFVAFALAFLLLSLGQAMLALSGIPDEDRSALYLFRLAAFLLIIFAIWAKNRRDSAAD